ncbi:MAG: M1 family aminopeptidase [Planctomycetota bacterium]
MHRRLSAQQDSEPAVRKYAPPRYVDLQHLKLDVTPDFRRRTVAGTATLEFAPVGKPLDELQLDAVDLNVSAVRSSVAIEDYAVTREHLTVTFVEPVAVGQKCVLEVEYSAEPQRGLYFRTPQQGYPAEDTHLFTQGEAQLARYWFPCHDYPNERTTTEIVCHVPTDMTVLSNGRLIGERSEGDMKAVHWRQEKPHVCYLVTLVAGYFSKLEDLDRKVPLAFYSQPTVAQHAGNSFRNTADILEFFDREIGVPFPWHKYFQVTVHDFQFGGMENTSMTTLAHRTITPSTYENVKSARIRKLDAHEMAHQWFGDYVTCKDWSHLWLNEGFATYYSHLYEGDTFGRDALLYDLYRDATAKVLPEHEDRRPIVYNRYKDPMEQFDYRVYPKGSWVLHMLRCQLGESLFRDIVRTYLERHALTSVTTADFVKVIEESSGRSFDRFFDQWVYHPRHPSLEIKYKWLAKQKLAHVSVKQTHKVDDEVLLFEFPTLLRFVVEGKPVDHPIEIAAEKQNFYVPLAKQPTVVRFDPDYTVLTDVDFEKSDKLLSAQLENEKDVIGRILAARALAERETKDSIAAVGSALRDDPFFGVRIEAAKALAKVEKNEALVELKTVVDASDARVRVAVVEAIGKRYSPAAESLLLDIVRREQNPSIAAAATRALGMYRTEQSQAMLRQQLRSESFRNDLVLAAIEAIGKQKEPALRTDIMQTLSQREPALTGWTIGTGLKQLAAICHRLDDVVARGDVEQFIRGYLDHPKRQVKVAAIEALGTLGDARSLGVLESLADEDGTDAISEAATKAMKQLQESSPLAPKELKELRDRVVKLSEESKQLREEVDELRSKRDASTKK